MGLVERIAEIAKICPNHREHLIVVTDGEVGENNIRQSDNLMNQYDIKFKFVSVYVIGSEGNLSVGAPFCRGCPNRTIQVLAHKRIYGPSLSLEEISAFKSLPNINSIDEFNYKYDKLLSAIKAKQLGKNADTKMMEILDALKDRLTSKFSNIEEKWKNLYDIASNGIHNFEIGTAGIKK